MKKNRKFLSLFLSVLSCATLVSCGEGNKTSAPVTSPSIKNEDERKIYTIAELIAMMPSDGSVTTERYYVRAKIKSIDDAGFGAMTIEDSTGTLYVYGTYSSDGVKRYSELDEKPVKGDTVLLYGTIQNYQSQTPEIKSGWIIEFTKGTPSWSEDDYTEMTIGEAREAAVGSLVKVTGIVSRITFALGKKPNGFIIVGDKSSIYVYDNQIATAVSEGNKITLLAKKTMFIASNEAKYAKQFGYKGACQLVDGHIVENDKLSNDIDFSFAKDITVKKLMNTSMSENITSLVYHSNAYIKKVQDDGYVNYYIDDLDQKTGSYTYTLCNGSDFSWIDQYDGKICSIYYTALNAKSTSTGSFYRFLPIKIEDKNYQFDKAYGPEFAVEYYGVDQFDEKYRADPAKEMITSVSSDLLNFGTATLSYSSSDTSKVYFDNEDGKTILHIVEGQVGTVYVTITGQLEGQANFEKSVKVTVAQPIDYSSVLTVKGSIDATKDTEILVKGVVGPSLVNQIGFYLIDETGVIAVRMGSDGMGNLSMGQTVIVRAKRDLWVKDDSTFGEQCLSNASIEENQYGFVNYSTSSFITGKTLKDISTLSTSDDYHTTEVYVLSAGIKKVEAKHYTNYYLVDGKTQILLYASKGAHYDWLDSYKSDNGVNKYSLEVAPCNWNSKSHYAACLLSITDSNGNKVMNTLNFKS